MAHHVFSSDYLEVWCGDYCDVLSQLECKPAACITDPPYAETTNQWDIWPSGWPTELSELLPDLKVLWSFGSFGMFMRKHHEFRDWKYAQDLVWEKPSGSGPCADRFMRVHELVVHFYRGKWSDLPHNVPRVPRTNFLDKSATPTARPPDQYVRHRSVYTTKPKYVDDGTRLVRSVVRANKQRGKNRLHAAEKPVDLIGHLVSESTNPGDTVIDIFSGSGSTGEAAMKLGRKAVLIDADPQCCEIMVKRLEKLVRFYPN